MEGKQPNWLPIGTPKGGIVCGLMGAVLAILLMFAGFWKTLMIALFFAAGFFFGATSNKTAAFKGWINKLFPPKGE